MSLGLTTAVRGWAHQRVRRAWQRRGALALALYPLHLLHRAWRGCAPWAYRMGRQSTGASAGTRDRRGQPHRGGTGKTPLVIELVAALRQRGWSPGVVSRGFGGRSTHATLVEVTSMRANAATSRCLIAT